VVDPIKKPASDIERSPGRAQRGLWNARVPPPSVLAAAMALRAIDGGAVGPSVWLPLRARRGPPRASRPLRTRPGQSRWGCGFAGGQFRWGRVGLRGPIPGRKLGPGGQVGSKARAERASGVESSARAGKWGPKLAPRGQVGSKARFLVGRRAFRGACPAAASFQGGLPRRRELSGGLAPPPRALGGACPAAASFRGGLPPASPRRAANDPPPSVGASAYRDPRSMGSPRRTGRSDSAGRILLASSSITRTPCHPSRQSRSVRIAASSA